MKNALNMKIFGVALLSAGLLFTGCKSAPELTQANALAMIQAKYDQTPAVGANILVDDLGMRQGATAKLWERKTIYPNKIWADFNLTPEGKKVLKLQKGGDVIQWRPENANDAHYSIIVISAVANHLKARDIKDITDEADGSKSAEFTEAVNLDGVPDSLQQIAHNPGNKLSTTKRADFVLEGGVWTLHSVI